MRNNFMEIERIKRAVGFFVKIKTIRNKHIGGPSYYDRKTNTKEAYHGI